MVHQGPLRFNILSEQKLGNFCKSGVENAKWKCAQIKMERKIRQNGGKAGYRETWKTERDDADWKREKQRQEQSIDGYHNQLQLTEQSRKADA